jgi:hypothetical protein
MDHFPGEMKMKSLPITQIGRLTILIAAISPVYPGCDDQGADEPSDTETESEAALTMEEAALHCPGEVDETEDGGFLCTVEGVVTAETAASEEALTWIAGMTYLLDGIVIIDGNSELFIEPGALILGSLDTVSYNPSSLYINRGSKIHAVGTKDKPIVFSSGAEKGNRSAGDWGGVVIRGAAPTVCGKEGDNVLECTDIVPSFLYPNGEGVPFGGSAIEDSSGELAFVRIEFAGKLLGSETGDGSPTSQGAVSLRGVGSLTDIHHLEVYRSFGIGLEVIGGVVPLHHIVVYAAAERALTWSQGWAGRSQFIVAHLNAGDDTAIGIEGQNKSDNENGAPRSNPILYNVTVAGSSTAEEAISLHTGTAGILADLLVVNNDGGYSTCVDVADDSTWNQTLNNNLSISGSIFPKLETCFADNEEAGFRESDWWADGDGNRLEDVSFAATTNDRPSFAPAKGSKALSGAVPPPLGMSFFEEVSFVGAMGEDDWTSSWTDYPKN